MQAKAVTKYVRISPLKVRPVMDVVRGMGVERALATLRYMPQKAAREVARTIMSAAANAENNFGLDVDELKVSTIYVEKGAVLKRFTARAKGRGNQIRKPTCHVYVTVGN